MGKQPLVVTGGGQDGGRHEVVGRMSVQRANY